MNRIYILLVAVIIIISGCSQPKALEYKNVQNFSIQRLNLKDPRLGADIVFYNPNKYSLRVKDADIDIYINEKFVGKTLSDKMVSVPANDTFSLPISVDVNVENLANSILPVIVNKEVAVRLQGSVKAGKGVFINIPIQYQGKEKLDVFLPR